jgi:hypothetical protein
MKQNEVQRRSKQASRDDPGTAWRRTTGLGIRRRLLRGHHGMQQADVEEEKQAQMYADWWIFDDIDEEKYCSYRYDIPHCCYLFLLYLWPAWPTA